jgi:uncharacterized protein YndB with AHSA1/START domain
MAQTDSNAGAADRESVHTRVLHASRSRYYVREPERFAQWWGPNGFRSTIHSFEVREVTCDE